MNTPKTSEVQIVESKEGGRAAIISQHDGYDAARLLLSGLHNRLASQLGRNFYVATPARDMFVGLSASPEPFIHRLRDRVQQDFRRLPYPISPHFFLSRATASRAPSRAKTNSAEAA